MYTVIHDQVEEFIKMTEEQRRQQPNLQDRKVDMVVSEEYMNELLKYDFVSTKKGRGVSSILINRKKNS
jgi:hypothetical protein